MMVRKKKPCNVPDCDRPTKARGLCKMHYKRATKVKDPVLRGEALLYASPPVGEDPPETPAPDIEAEMDATDQPEPDPPSPEEIGVFKRRTRVAKAKPADPLAVAAARAAQQRISTVCAFALLMGLGRPTLNELTGERVWISPHDGTVFVLDKDGRAFVGGLAVDELFDLDDDDA